MELTTSQRIIEILAEYTGDPKDKIHDQTYLRHTLNLDSLDMVDIILEIEEDFELPEIDTFELEQCITVADLVEVVEQLIIKEEARHELNGQ